jgi:hypothetical protein
MNQVAPSPATVPSTAINPRIFCPVFSSSRGSSIITIMPKIESTISGKTRT